MIAPPKSSKAGELCALTGLRGLAAWYVVLFHMRGGMGDLVPVWFYEFISKGYLAVDLFFMLSGFVIWLTYADTFQDRGLKFSFDFLWRRFARIWPLHLFVLAGGIAFAAVLWLTGRADPLGYPVSELPLHIVLLQNWGFTDKLTWNHPAWSISTEFAAYLMFPFLAVCVDWKKCSSAMLIAALLALAMLLFAAFDLNGHDDLGDDISGMGLIRCLVQFGMGTLLCALYRRWENIGRAHTCALACAGLIAAYIWAVPWETLMIPLIFATALLGLALARDRWSMGLLGRGPVHYLGEISYSTYLVHFLMYIAFKIFFVDDPTDIGTWAALGFLAVVLLSSIAFYHGIERPAQKWLNARNPMQLGRGVAIG